MKKATITISYDEEKLAALKMYLGQKGQSVENELERCAETLYNKTVPVGVRDFIGMKNGNASIKQKKTKPFSFSAVGEKSAEDKE